MFAANIVEDRMKVACCAVLLTAVLLTAPATAAAQSGFELTIENIMRGPEHIGQSPSAVRWSEDGRWIYFQWLPGGEAWDASQSMYRVSSRGGEPEKLTDEQADSLDVVLSGGDESADGRWRTVSSDGDLHLIDLRSMAVRRLTHTRAVESLPVFRNDGRAVYYVSDNQLFEFDLDNGGIRQVTDLRSGPVPSDPEEPEGQRGFLADQQKELFEYIRRQSEQQARNREDRRTAEERQELKTVYLNREERVTQLRIERGGAYAVISTTRPAPNTTRRVPIPFWVTESGYTETREVRTKVGDTSDNNGRIGIVSLTDGDVRWVDLEAAAGTNGEKRELAGTSFIGWNDQGSAGLIGASAADFKDGWLWSMDAATGELTLLTNLRDEAWVAGPCAFWFGCSGWLPDGDTVWYTAEHDGYNHLYTVNRDGTGQRQLTSGPFEVHSVSLSDDERRFWISTSEGSPFERHFYHVDFDGSNRTRITSMAGSNSVTPSPDGQRLAIVRSFSNEPGELYVANNRAGAEAARITTTPTEQWRSFDWIAPEIVHFTASDGVQVPARIYRPADMGAQPNGAAVIFVHGAGYLQNVHNWWSTYYREYMFHHILAARGYVVLDIDYRASSGYGRDWRTAIYRHMGGKDLSDQVDGSRYLQQTYGIDPERIGLYGGSYGGFITLMALFNAPGDFGAGAALRSVTDWAHYNHGYTGRILNLPQDDSIAYERSSPIYFAEGLEDPLLIAHGMVDTNVHFSDVVRLAQRLIELGKRDWEMAVYPVEDHGFVVPSSWTDEYRRILELFERHLNPMGDPASVM
jgi:dipeptidyl aminopeptidase/acylaminoacyl peptidase